MKDIGKPREERERKKESEREKKTFINKHQVRCAEFQLPNVYAVSAVFPHPISIFTTS